MKKVKEKLYASHEEIAEFLGISRMQLYRLAKIVPLPRFIHGYGSRRYEQKPWTEADILGWQKEVSKKHQFYGRWRRSLYS